MNLVEFITARADEDQTEAGSALWTAAKEILGYEAEIDREFGCCHSADEIARGKCHSVTPESVTGLVSIAAVWHGHPDYDERWRP